MLTPDTEPPIIRLYEFLYVCAERRLSESEYGALCILENRSYPQSVHVITDVEHVFMTTWPHLSLC